MNKVLLLIALSIAVISCDNKKEKLDELHAKQTVLKKQVDSIGKLKHELEMKRDPLATDTANEIQIIRYTNDIRVVENELAKVNSSIDSLGKY